MDPPKRERKRVVNYAENEYFRQAMKAGGAARGGGPRLPKMPQLQARTWSLRSGFHLEFKEQGRPAGPRAAAGRACPRCRSCRRACGHSGQGFM